MPIGRILKVTQELLFHANLKVTKIRILPQTLRNTRFNTRCVAHSLKTTYSGCWGVVNSYGAYDIGE